MKYYKTVDQATPFKVVNGTYFRLFNINYFSVPILLPKCYYTEILEEEYLKDKRLLCII